MFPSFTLCLVNLCIFFLFLLPAAKLGRRSHKMRELISEASRTIEDSQTAQALHGLLSLKSLESTSSPNDFPNLMRVISSSSGQKSDEFVGLDTIPGMTNSAFDHSTATSASSSRTSSQAFLREVLKDAGAPSKVGARSGGGMSLVVRMPQGQDQQHSVPKTKAIKPKVLPDTVQRTPMAGVHTSSVERLQVTGGGEQVMTGLQLPVIGAKSPASAEGQYRVVFVTPPTTAKTVQSTTTSSSLTVVTQPEVQQAVPLQLIATSCGMLAFPQNIQLQQLVRQSPTESATLSIATQALAPTQTMTPIVITPTSTAKKQIQSSGWPLSFVAATPTSALEPATVVSTKRKISPASADPNRQTKLLRTSLATTNDSSIRSIIYPTTIDDKTISQGLVFSSQSTAVRAPAIAPRDSNTTAIKGVVSPIIVDVKGNQFVSMLPKLASAPLATSTTTTTPILSAQLLSNSFMIQRPNDGSGSSVDLLALAAESSGCQATSFGISGLSDVVEKRESRLTSQINDGFDKFFGKLQSQSDLRMDSNGTREVRGSWLSYPAYLPMPC